MILVFAHLHGYMSVHANVQQVFAIYMRVCLSLHLLIAKSYIDLLQ